MNDHEELTKSNAKKLTKLGVTKHNAEILNKRQRGAVGSASDS